MDMIFYGVLMVGMSRLSASLQISQSQIEVTEETIDAAVNVTSSSAPCFVDDILAALRETLEEDGRLRLDSLTQFGVCSENSLMFQEIAAQARNNGFGLHSTEVLVKMEEDRKTLILTFNPPESPQMMMKPVLLLPTENMIKTSSITFTSSLLNPSTQTPCTSEETKFILMTGKEGHFPQTWKINMSLNTERDVAEGGNTGNTVSFLALLLFSPQRGTDSSPPSSRDLSHNSFLCELRHFLVQSFPLDQDVPVVSLESLRSVPSQPLGLSSSESLLAGLINSSAPTVLSFSQGSMLQAHREELDMSPALMEELRVRLEQTLEEVLEVMREDGRARGRLHRLKTLSGLPFTQSVEGAFQYRAFLLFKVLQTASHALSPPRGQRSARDHSTRAPRSVCGLSSLSVSLQRYVIAPSMATINNCQGSCSFPMIRGSNHAILLNSHLDSGHTDTRAPCCVPVTYDPLEVVKLEEKETSLEIEPNMVATECECR